MGEQTIKVQTQNRDAMDVATELTKAMNEKGYFSSVEEVSDAFQSIFNVAVFAYANKSNPKNEPAGFFLLHNMSNFVWRSNLPFA
jgi:hypothetical protein